MSEKRTEYKFLPWPRPMTAKRINVCLGIAVCALDKIANYTEEDEAIYGDPGFFSRVTLDEIKRACIEHKGGE